MVSNQSPKVAKFKNHKAQSLRENNPERCMEILLQFQNEKQDPKSLAAKVGMEEYIALHADLQPNELPWPGDCQAAIERAGKK